MLSSEVSVFFLNHFLEHLETAASVFIIHKFSYHYLGISILWGLGHKWILRVLPWFIIHRINLYDVGVVLRTFYASIEPHVDSYDLSFTYSKLQWFIGMLILFLCIFQTSYICTFIYLTKIRNQNVNWKKKYRNLKEQLININSLEKITKIFKRSSKDFFLTFKKKHL